MGDDSLAQQLGRLHPTLEYLVWFQPVSNDRSWGSAVMTLTVKLQYSDVGWASSVSGLAQPNSSSWRHLRSELWDGWTLSLYFSPLHASLSQKSLKSFWYRACHTVSIQWVTVNESMWPLFLFSIIQHQLTFYLTLLSKFHCRLSLHKLCSIFFQLSTLILPANFGWFQGKPHDSDLALFSFSILLIILQLAKILTNTEFFYE